MRSGLERPLPNGHGFADKDGKWRNEVRVQWWKGGATLPMRDAVLADDRLLDQLPADETLAIPEDARYGADAPPVFFGHYWLPPHMRPAPRAPNVACLDHSVGKGGPLVAYQYRGERTLCEAHFVLQPQADL